ncbi:hypothetical protein GWN26_09155, partial [Candidatus Saccharibacteria bacterium]|nr:hypothetical protein [Candidatus Saccharibacteria bacterium]NIV03943.1 hypothetical protein [Calditrichia bacterium]NIV72308.1 hypothetical protein [Calditrichia bacterium]NIV99287.1 hypothetical protein [Candidatus Saccharibacteria bacterium]
MKLHAFLMLLGALHGIFLALVLLSNRASRNTANGLLATILLIFSGYLFEHYLILENLVTVFPHLIAAFVPFLFLLGPLYFFYVKATLDQPIKVQPKDFLHIAPAFICFLTIVPFYLQSAENKIARVEACDPNNFQLPANRAIYFGALFIQMATYIYITWQFLKQQKIIDRRSFKNGDAVFRWLHFFTIGFAYLLVCFLAVFLLFLFTNFHLYMALFTLLLVPAFLIHAIGYWAIKESVIIHGNGAGRSNGRYQNSRLSESLASNLKRKLLNLMETEKIYRESKMGLPEISKRLSVNSRYLSQLVNQEFQCRLTDFINAYRIDEAKRMLIDKKYSHLSLLGI